MYVEIRHYRCKNWMPVAFFATLDAAQKYVAGRTNDADSRVTVRISNGRPDSLKVY